MFARHYYAAYHANTGEPASEPQGKDSQVATRFVERLLAFDPNEAKVPDWGRQFGAMMRERHRGDARARPYLSSALVLYGDEFLRRLQQQTAARQEDTLGKMRVARQAALMLAYLRYLQDAEAGVQRSDPAAYAKFTDQRRLTRHQMTGGLFLASADTVARFDSETNRLLAFAEFFGDRVPDFWRWEAQSGLDNGAAALAADCPPRPDLVPPWFTERLFGSGPGLRLKAAGAKIIVRPLLVKNLKHGMTQMAGHTKEVQHNGRHDEQNQRPTHP